MKRNLLILLATLTFSASCYANTKVLPANSSRVFVLQNGISYIVDKVARVCFLQRVNNSSTAVAITEVSCDKLKKHSAIAVYLKK